MSEFVPGIQYFSSLLLKMSVLYILLCFYEGVYFKRELFWEEAKEIVKVTTVWIIIVFAYLSIAKETDNFSRMVIFFVWLFSIPFFPLIHYLTKKLFLKINIFQIPVIIVGAGDIGKNVAYGLLKQKYLGYDIAGFFDDSYDKKDNIVIANKKFAVLGRLNDIEKFLVENEIWTAIVANPIPNNDRLTELINLVQRYTRRVIVVPELKGVSIVNTRTLYLFEEGLFLLKITNNLKSATNRFIKRIFDVVVSIMMLPVIIPIIIFIALLIKIDSPGPVFFVHHRMGRNKRSIPVLKFRTMYKNSKELLEKLLDSDPNIKIEWQENFKLKDDPRITKVGKWLRKTSLDELPQIFNVLAGHMSLVGPRPVLKEEIDMYYGDYSYYYYLVPPGITGLWQVSGRSDVSYEQRVWMDSWYVLNWSIWMDIVLIFKTLKSVFKCEGAY
jgi:undecaprenyl-phosphate galactose phosphotransferase